MNLPAKSTVSSAIPERHWSEDLARIHCLQVLFPDWTGNDRFLLRQLKDSIEASIRNQPDLEDSFERFFSMAQCLREESGNPASQSHAFIRLDYSERSWDPLFARQELVRLLKKQAGVDHIFLLVIGLRRALFPRARYRTRAREAAYDEATRFIDNLARHWSTTSSRIHLLYL